MVLPVSQVFMVTMGFGCALCLPMRNGNYIYPEENSGVNSVFLSEGDIIVDLRRNAVKDFLQRTWLNRTVPFVIDRSYDEKQRLEIQMAMGEFEEKTCIKFIPRYHHPDYIRILPDGSCSSSVGRKGGRQDISIGSDCDNKGTIMHELMHALGFWHEHSRPDRDKYIEIKWDNIATEHENNFKSYSDQDIDTLGAPYDYGSIMHYRNNTFAQDRSKPTIVSKFPLPAGVIMGQRERLSDIDVMKINRLYRCNISSCPDPGIPKNGRRLGHDFNVSMVVSYRCDAGYTLVGSKARYCMDIGEWTGNLPMCIHSNKGGALHYCNFDHYDLCGWKQDYFDERNWTLRNSTTPSSGTGPVEDHTMGTSEGFYIYLEASSPCAEGDRARLISKTFDFKTKACVAFHYNMYGRNMGQLNVYQRVGGKNIPKFSLFGSHDNNWHLAVFALNDSTSFQLVIEAVRGSTYSSDMAIDDVIVGSCDSMAALINDRVPERMVCNFNGRKSCGWIQLKDDQFDWSMKINDTFSMATGPDCDPTNCVNGTYLYTETSSPRKKGDVAKIATPLLKGGGSHCLSFSYHMYGSSMGKLNVSAVELGMEPRRLWSKSGDKGNMWHRAQIDFTPNSAFQVVFEGERGKSYYSDMAIDNVDIINGECSDIIHFDCTFDHGWCGWTQEKAPFDTWDWLRLNHTTWTPSTGPSADHTTGHGFFVYLETSKAPSGSVAQLLSPRLTDEPGGFCFEFYYHMYGHDIQYLRVTQKPLDGWHHHAILWEDHGDRGNWWRPMKIWVPSIGQGFQIVMEASAGGMFGDVAIDDLSITLGSCTSNDARVLSDAFPFLTGR